MRKFKFERLEVWDLSLELIDEMYAVAERLPSKERFNLAQQLRRAATSISLNVAEGSTGQSDPEQSRFLGLAIRSLIETVACLRLVARHGYLDDSGMLARANKTCHNLARKLQAMRRSLSTVQS
jgi:four helix bundle protein